MGLDWFAACKIENGRKVECPETAGYASYSDPRFRRAWCFNPRHLGAYILDNLEEGLVQRFFGVRGDRGRKYHPQEAIDAMPATLDDADLPPVMTASAALELANDLEKVRHGDAADAVKYLRFWASNGHPIFCSY